jgi:hypothetical protein
MKRDTHNPVERHRSRVLLILTSLYGLLYLALIVAGYFGPSDPEDDVVRFLFVLFLVGYIITWKNEGLGGLIFVLWWIGMWYLGLFVAQTDRGAAIVMGFPLFVLAVLFIIAWYKKRARYSTTSSTDKPNESV